MPDAARIAQANALEVPVTIQGSKIVAGTEQRELFTETTKTTLTFDNGAVLNLKVRVLAGQSVFLRNEQSGREILCRVLESPPEGQTGYTDLEFTVHDPEFWATPAEKPAAAAQTSEIQEVNEAAGKSLVAASIREDLAPNYEEVPALPPETPTPLPSSHLPETTEASPEPPEAVESNDTKDEEQLAALLVREAKRAAKRATAAKETKQVEQAPASEDAANQSQTTSAVASKAKAFSTLAFRLHAMRQLTTGKNAVAVGIVASVLIAAAIGFIWHTVRGTFIHEDDRPFAASTQSAQHALPAGAPPSQVPASAVAAGGPATAPAPSASKSEHPTVAQEPPVKTAMNSAGTAAALRVAPRGKTVEDSAASAAPKAGTGRAVLNADAAALGQGKHRRPNQLIAQETIPAKIVSQTQPAFPPWAKDLDVDGVVKLDAVIDEKGNVTETKLLSGPRVLRHAAERAIELWIFEPAQSDGKPTATHMELTVEFQR